MNPLSRTILAAILGSHLVLAQAPTVQITNVPSGLTLSITSLTGIVNLDITTFGFYMDGADVTAPFVALVLAGNPLVTVTGNANNITVVIAGNLTAFKFASHVCTNTGLCGSFNVAYEGFHDTAQRDTTFIPTFGQPPRWNDASAPGQLAGRALAGSPGGTNPATLGTRVQYVVDPLPNSVNPAGLFSPFDASVANSGGQCGPTGCNLGVNPGGGSHIMHLYESVELGNIEDSLEQIEWSPVTGVVAQTTYPNYRIWCGVSSISAPMSAGAIPGLQSVFDSNYNLLPYQTGIPVQASCGPPGLSARKVPCGGPAPYTTALMTTNFCPFPVLSPCFDFSTSTGFSGTGVNLLFEQDIAPGSQVPNFNRYRATAFIPVRRLIDAPLALATPGVCPFNLGGTFDIYKSRFTFVGLVAQARSLWYDTGTANPNYLSFIPSPLVGGQPAGTQSTWILEGTDTSNPGPATPGVGGTYIDAAGNVFPNVLSVTIAQLRYFRFRLELRGNNVTNSTPSYDKAAMVFY